MSAPLRYSVKLVTGMCLGSGMFQVFDSLMGHAVSGLYHFRDTADFVAARLNAEDRQAVSS